MLKEVLASFACFPLTVIDIAYFPPNLPQCFSSRFSSPRRR